MRRTLRSLAAVSLVASLALSACSGSDDTSSDEPSDTGSATPTTSVSLPAGVTLTEAGAELAFGETAYVEYAPTKSVSTVLSLRVDSAQQGTLSDLEGFNVNDDPYKKHANYYYVHVTVKNLGSGDVGGRSVPLDGVNAEDTLLPPVVFVSEFKKCPGSEFPKAFGEGEHFKACLVFLSPDHGDLKAVSYQLSESEQPILWTGEVTVPKTKVTKKPRKKSTKR